MTRTTVSASQKLPESFVSGLNATKIAKNDNINAASFFDGVLDSIKTSSRAPTVADLHAIE